MRDSPKQHKALLHKAEDKDLCVPGSYFLFLEVIVIESWLLDQS